MEWCNWKDAAAALRPGWMGLWATWSSGGCPCSWQGGWNQMIFKVPSNPYHSMILKKAGIPASVLQGMFLLLKGLLLLLLVWGWIFWVWFFLVCCFFFRKAVFSW